MERQRGDGETTRQMTKAPHKAVFVWVNQHLSYPKDLARQLGRQDIEIVSPAWLEYGWRGRELTGLIVDHALTLKDRQFEYFREATTRVRIHGQSLDAKK